ncbi:MAG: patatin-like phospholipase family protein [Magnetococcales bacterium]|nr:patatin-like phospholipase family protein [Magnetococcales bacterium]
MPTTTKPIQTADKPNIALVLQGGGALGAYHVGVYQAISEAGLLPNWVSGISIGALTSCILVGNRPENRLARLEQFWHDISVPDEWGSFLQGEARTAFNHMSNLRSLMFGQPNFWFNRPINPMFLPYVPPEMTSICDTSPMLSTLQRLADFDLINNGPVRLSLGVTNVQTGELSFFDNTTQPRNKPLRPEHVLASGSLPPGFPPIRIDGVLYWDGGCVANTPVEIIFDEQNTRRPDILILVELYNPEGKEPTSMDAVKQREKSIRFGDRTLSHLKHIAVNHNLRTHLHHANLKLAKEDSNSTIQEVAKKHTHGGMDILHLIYHPNPDQITNSEAEFSRPSIADRRKAGYEDMQRLLAEDPIRRDVRQHPGEIIIHRYHKGQTTSHRHI